jgi:Apea-like HEPN
MSPRRDIDELYLSAIQWAGRATVEPRREEAFLLFAIALESLILPTSDPMELTYRLRIRTAHLLGATARERERISEETGKLYGIRSNIVHNGYYQITEVELARIKRKTKQAIFALLSSRTAQGCKDKKELNKWFENKILS